MGEKGDEPKDKANKPRLSPKDKANKPRLSGLHALCMDFAFLLL
jgi:hypothetical protein